MEVTQRSYQFDNMKGIAILAVVVGHFIQPGIKTNVFLQDFFYFLYLWHMPVICVISGMLFTYSQKAVNKRAMTFLSYAVVGQLIYSLVCWWLGLDLSYYSLLWYLIALTVWVLLAPWVIKYTQSQKSRRIALSLSVLAGIGAGFINVESTSIITPRIITYFPYFLLGLMGINNRGNKSLLYTILFVGCASALIGNIETINYRSVFLNQGYEVLDSGIGIGIVSRLGIYIAGLSAVILAFEWVSSEENQLTRVGAYSLPIYLMHGVAIKLVTTLEWVDYANSGIVLMEALGLAIGIILMTRWYGVRKLIVGMMACCLLLFGQATTFAEENQAQVNPPVIVESWKATGTELEKVLASLKKVRSEKTNTNMDIEKLKLYLKNSGIESMNRSSNYNGKVHESLVVQLESGRYNLDLSHTLVSDKIMIVEGFQFAYDDLCLDSPDPFKKEEKAFKYYAQSDLKWKFKAFSRKNIWSTGCGVMCTAMIYHYLTPEDVTVSPKDTIKIAIDNDLDIKETPRVDMPKLLSLLSKEYKVPYKVLKPFDNRKLKTKDLKKKIADWKTKELVKNEIAAGKIVLISTLLNDKLNYTSGVEHFLIVLAYEKGEAIVVDPLPDHTFSKEPTLEVAKKIDGYKYQVPVDDLLEKMTQAYSFENKEVK